MFCPKCGKEIIDGAQFCIFCGTKVEGNQSEVIPPSACETQQNLLQPEGKSFVATALLSMIPAPNGLHRFYTGHVGTGVILLFTNGLYLIWSTIDVIRILTNSFTDKNGCKLKGYTKGKAFILFLVWISIYGLFIYALVSSEPQSKVKQANTTATNNCTATATEEKQPAKKEAENKPKPLPKIEKPHEAPIMEGAVTEYPENKNKPKPLPKIEKPYEAPIMEGAVTEYPENKKELQKAGFSKTLKKLGLEGFKKANKLMPIAAKKAASNKKCDAVMLVDISDKSTKDNLIIFVWAKNQTKFYFTEAELMNDGPVLSEQEKLAPLLMRHTVLAEEVIKSQLNHPSTYDRHELGVFSSQTTPSCNEITIEFSAKNGFGLELTYIATVQFDVNSKVVGFHMQEKR